MIIASTSTIYGSEYLEYILSTLQEFFKDINEVLFIPYARPSGITYDEYTSLAAGVFSKINISIKGIHQFKDPKKAIENARAIFTGGGNTFELVTTLYKYDLMDIIKNTVENGTLYFGTSAGSNITCKTMQTTNDMPIIHPPSFKTLGLIPFNINAHYLDPDLNSKHKGETRETRIKEFHTYNELPVLGLREGSWLEVNDETIILKGSLTAKLFCKSKEAIEIKSGELNYKMW